MLRERLPGCPDVGLGLKPLTRGALNLLELKYLEEMGELFSTGRIQNCPSNSFVIVENPPEILPSLKQGECKECGKHCLILGFK